MLNVAQQIISDRLKAMGKIQKCGKWVPHELNERQMENRKNNAGQPSTTTAKTDRFGKKAKLCVWWDQIDSYAEVENWVSGLLKKKRIYLLAWHSKIARNVVKMCKKQCSIL